MRVPGAEPGDLFHGGAGMDLLDDPLNSTSGTPKQSSSSIRPPAGKRWRGMGFLAVNPSPSGLSMGEGKCQACPRGLMIASVFALAGKT
ncbi:hypothetical protein QFZ23_004767 [Arthrobacter globiformis]|nr:hypothetical protein [Arthrobacter globiformis]